MSMKSKIAALLRKAESTQFKEEAETFLAKARELMEKHQITIVEGESDEKDEFGLLRTNDFEIGTSAAIKYELQAAVAQFFGCRVFQIKSGKRAHMDIHGTDSALTTYELMFPFIWKQVRSLARSFGVGQSQQRKLERDIARSLMSRLYLLRIENEANRQGSAASGSSTALALTSIDQRLDDFARSQYEKIGEAKKRNLKAPSQLSRLLANEVALDMQIQA